MGISKSNIINSIIAVYAIVFIATSIFYCGKPSDDQNNRYCDTKKRALKGLIVYTNKKSGYSSVNIDNEQKSHISISLAKNVYRRGFSAYYSCEVGDSIIKMPNSDEFIIKNGENKAVYLLECWE